MIKNGSGLAAEGSLVFTHVLEPWLPDGLFSYKKSKFGYILEGLGILKCGIFYNHF
jgi:hypothetical protein